MIGNNNKEAKFSPSKMVSLAHFDEEDEHARPVNTPRSLQACKKYGINPEDLVKKYTLVANNHFVDHQNFTRM